MIKEMLAGAHKRERGGRRELQISNAWAYAMHGHVHEQGDRRQRRGVHEIINQAASPSSGMASWCQADLFHEKPAQMLKMSISLLGSWLAYLCLFQK